ncbi:MAG: uroporphyrinogen-III synthase, partial [Deltaproteobacteria bacterium]|nr:uroporphyrinogen-III synthase [Deltaproteobacteria bacterium]
MSVQPGTEASPREPNFGGLRVVAFESRMASETARLIERNGGHAMVAPAMREIPLGDNPAALEFAERLLAGQIDIAVFLTGVGVRALFQVMETRHPRPALTAALARIVMAVRGPKPQAALRDYGLEPSLQAPEPNTWRELLEVLTADSELRGKRIAVQEYGVSNRDLVSALEARGAEVMIVPVYRWTLPVDRGPLTEALRAIANGQAEVALFTSSNQVTNVMQMADAQGIGDAVRRRLGTMVVGSVGPVCSQELRARGIPADLEPGHPRLGHLIKEAALRSATILAAKRSSPAVAVTGSQPRRPLEAGDAPRSRLWDHPFLKACRREAADYTPIWLMRQAGRYMPEYRRVRDRHDFIEMCMQPELAAEVTIGAVERLGVDAAIIFADILLPLIPMQVGLHYEKGDGPIIDRPVRSAADLARIPDLEVSELAFVGEAIKLVDRAIGARTPIIGFAGAPFTLASYLIEGGSSRQYQTTKTLMYNEPETWHRLMEL